MSPFRRLLGFLALLVPACGLVFLLAGGFFQAWEGRVVSVRPAGRATPPVAYRVLIVEPDGRAHERTWPADVVEPLGRPIDRSGLPPLDVPEDAPLTRKSRHQLFFLVQQGDDRGFRVVPTTRPSTLGLTVLCFLVGLGARNLFVSGSPLAITPRRHRHLAPLPPAGQVVRADGPRRSEKGPPPPRPGRGRGRR